jgi:hypothetical protein
VIQLFNASEKHVMPPEIDLYCERTAVGLFNEPLGLISNVAFLIAAFYLSRQPRQSIASYLLIAWLSMIGIGSGLFHAFATTATLLMDVIPIQGLILTAIWVLYAIHLKWKWWVVFGLMALCVLVSAELPRNWLNGSAGYLPAWILLMIAATLHQPGLSRRYLLMATLLFPISLTFRSIDNLLCQAIPSGTHFMWHVCNALVLFWIVRSHQSMLEENSLSDRS